METEQLFLDPSLNLSSLAKELSLPYYQISALLKDAFDQNLSDFVNDYRIDYAKKLLLEKKLSNPTMSSIGFDSGFNSDNTFFRVFKEKTGCTPKEYLNRTSAN